MNQKDNLQVNTLCKWITVKLKPSDIDGVGVFAIKDMPSGTRLFADIMPEIFKLPYKTLKNNTPAFVHDTITQQYPRVKYGEAFVFPTVRWVAYMNHSDDPNYDAINDILLKDVKEGEEITENYRNISGAEELFPFLKN